MILEINITDNVEIGYSEDWEENEYEVHYKTIVQFEDFDMGRNIFLTQFDNILKPYENKVKDIFNIFYEVDNDLIQTLIKYYRKSLENDLQNYDWSYSGAGGILMSAKWIDKDRYPELGKTITKKNSKKYIKPQFYVYRDGKTVKLVSDDELLFKDISLYVYKHNGDNEITL